MGWLAIVSFIAMNIAAWSVDEPPTVWEQILASPVIWPSLLTSAISATAIVVGAIVVGCTISANKKIARVAVTHNVMLAELGNEKIAGYLSYFLDSRSYRRRDRVFLDPNSHEDLAVMVVPVVAYYEMLASSVARNLADEEMYKNWHRRRLVLTWYECRLFVELRRITTQDYDYSIAFEALALKWATQTDKDMYYDANRAIDCWLDVIEIGAPGTKSGWNFDVSPEVSPEAATKPQ